MIPRRTEVIRYNGTKHIPVVSVLQQKDDEMEDGGQIFLAIVSSVCSITVLVIVVLMCGWCFGKRSDDEEDDEDEELNLNVDITSRKYLPVSSQSDIDSSGVRKLTKRSWDDKAKHNPTPILSQKSIRFERPGRSQVVTEHVQPAPNTHSSLHDALSTRRGSTNTYQTMSNTTPVRKPLVHSDSQKSQSADDVNGSLWKGMRNIAFTLMDNATQDELAAAETPPIDPAEGIDCKLGKIQVSLNYDFQSMTLTLKVFQATGLPAKDFTGTSDPYVKILLMPDKKHKLVTKVKKKNLNPKWNECFLFEGWPHNKLLEKTLYLQVIDYDRFSRDDPIGETYIPLNVTDLSQSPAMWRYLQPCKDSRGKLGEILLSLCYQPAVGRLTVIVMKCKDLKAKDITGASDPYVKLWLMYGNSKVEKKKTSIKMRTLNPVYNESFIYDIPWDKIREAAIEITVMDFDKLGRNEMIGKIQLSSKSGPLETRHWNDMITKPRQQVAQWHLLKD